MRPVNRLLLGLTIFAAALAPRVSTQDPFAVGGDRYPDRILVKLVEDSHTLRDGKVRLAARSKVFDRAVAVERAITQPLAVLDAWFARCNAALGVGDSRPGHLGLWFRLRARDLGHAETLLAELAADPLIATAYLEPIVHLAGKASNVVADIPPPTPDLTSFQTYRGAAPTGFGVDATHAMLGARGEDVRFYHLEEDWFVRHEDLQSITNASYVGAVTSQNSAGANHGTAVIGLVAATRNSYGMTGVADLATVQLVSWGLAGGVGNAVALAIAHGRAGDVMAMIGGYNLRLTKPEDYVPMEFFQLDFDAIRTATAMGFLVLEAAMNGDNDLDDPRFARRFDLSFRDSGAIMVAATDGPALTRASFSNFGSRIDTNGWGGEVATIGYGDLFFVNRDSLQAYSRGYAGTSAATACLSGVVTTLASTVARQRESILTPGELRGLLRSHGTPIPGDIGRRPDLLAMLGSLGLPDGLTIDRFEVDLGGMATITMRGPVGGGFALAMSAARGDVDLGLGRRLHLDPSAILAVLSRDLPAGSDIYPLVVPVEPSLSGLELYFQGVIVDPNGPTLRMSSSLGLHLR
jgi:hypothetical protein